MVALFPRQATNDFRGQKLALWIFGLVLLMKAAISLGSTFNAHQAAGQADGIPLDTFGEAAARAFLSIFMLLGWSNLMLCVVGIVVLARYRGLVPMMFAVWLFYDAGKRAIFSVAPIVRAGGSGGSLVNLIILALMVAGFALSLVPSKRSGTTIAS